MGTTGRFGNPSNLFRGHPNCTFPFLLHPHFIAYVNWLFTFTNCLFLLFVDLIVANIDQTDYSELFVGFMFVSGFFFTTVLLLCSCLFVFWLKRHCCPNRAAESLTHDAQRHRHRSVQAAGYPPISPYYSTQRANITRWGILWMERALSPLTAQLDVSWKRTHSTNSMYVCAAMPLLAWVSFLASNGLLARALENAVQASALPGDVIAAN